MNVALSLMLFGASASPDGFGDSGQTAKVLQGWEVSIIHNAARRADLSPENLECYDIVIQRSGDEIRIGFVPAEPVTTVNGYLRKEPNKSCRPHSFEYRIDGRFIRRLNERKHSVIH